MKSKPSQTELPLKTNSATNAESQPDNAKDRHGYTYAQLLAVQARQLRWWKELLTPAAYTALEKFCQRTNRPARSGEQFPHGLHQVPRGVAISHFLQDRAKFLLDDEDGEDVWMRDGIPPRAEVEKKPDVSG